MLALDPAALAGAERETWSCPRLVLHFAIPVTAQGTRPEGSSGLKQALFFFFFFWISAELVTFAVGVDERVLPDEGEGNGGGGDHAV